MLQWIKSKYERRLFMDESLKDGPNAPEYMDITVGDPQSSQEGGQSFTTYVVSVVTNVEGFPSKNFSIRKRYSAFRTLYAELSALTKGKATKLPPFPPRTFLKPGEGEKPKIRWVVGSCWLMFFFSFSLLCRPVFT